MSGQGAAARRRARRAPLAAVWEARPARVMRDRVRPWALALLPFAVAAPMLPALLVLR